MPRFDRTSAKNVFGKPSWTYPYDDNNYPHIVETRVGRTNEAGPNYFEPHPEFPAALLIDYVSQPGDGTDANITETYEVIPGKWVYTREYDPALGAVMVRKRLVRNDGQVSSISATSRITYDAYDGSSTRISFEIERLSSDGTGVPSTDAEGRVNLNPLFPVITTDGFDDIKGAIQRSEQIVVATGSEVGSQTLVGSTVTEINYEPSAGNQFLLRKIIQVYTLPGVTRVNREIGDFGGLETLTKTIVPASTSPSNTVATSGVTGATVTRGGSGYTSAPTVTPSGGGGTGAAFSPVIGPIGLTTIAVTAGGSGYTVAPTVNISGAHGGVAVATLGSQNVASVSLAAGGAGYAAAPSAPPTVAISGGGGTGATASAVLASTGVQYIAPVNFGIGYTSAPTVSFTGGGGTGAAAFSELTNSVVQVLTITNSGSGYTSAPTVIFSPTFGSGASATAFFSSGVNTITVGSGGSGFSGPPRVVIGAPDLPGGVQAVAYATVSTGGVVTSVGISTAGSGYSVPPAVSFVDFTGTGATATAALVPTSISAVTLNAGGVYTSAPAITFSGGGGGISLAITATIGKGVAYYTVTNPGTGYTSQPTVVLTGGSGTGATASSLLAPAAVASITVTASGSGYTSVPTVTFASGSGAGASATAVLGRGVASIAVTNAGSGYTSVPAITFTPTGAGSGASATASIGAAVTGVTVTSAGSGYTSSPSLAFSGGGGTGARATALVGTSATTQHVTALDSVTAELDSLLRSFGTYSYSIEKVDGGVPGSRATVNRSYVLSASAIPDDSEYTTYERKPTDDPNVSIQTETTYALPPNFVETQDNAASFPRLLNAFVDSPTLGRTEDARAAYSDVVPHYIYHTFTTTPQVITPAVISEVDSVVFGQSVRGLIDSGFAVTRSGVTYNVLPSTPTRQQYITSWIGVEKTVGGSSEIWRAGIYHNRTITLVFQ